MHRNSWLYLLIFSILLGPTIVYGSDLPEVQPEWGKLTRAHPPKPTLNGQLWTMVWDRAEGAYKNMLKDFDKKMNLKGRPLHQNEVDCAMSGLIGSAAKFLAKGAAKMGEANLSSMALDIATEMDRMNQDKCNKPGPGAGGTAVEGSPNRGKEMLQSWRPLVQTPMPGLIGSAWEEVKTKIRDLRNRPLTGWDMALAVAAAILTAPIWALP